jgi:hypothetical protein
VTAAEFAARWRETLAVEAWRRALERAGWQPVSTPVVLPPRESPR